MSGDEPTSVYLYRDCNGMLIYVGITARSVTRNLEHNKTKEWWGFVTRQEVEHYETRQKALAREATLIAHHSPPFNIQQNPNHEAMRAAYLLFRSVDKDVRSPEQIFRETMGFIPLHKFSITNDVVVLRCNPEHFSLVSILKSPPGRFMPMVMLNQKKVGIVKDVKEAGAFFWFKLSIRKWVSVANGAMLRVKRVNALKPELGFRMSKIWINEDPVPVEDLAKARVDTRIDRRIKNNERLARRRLKYAESTPAT